MSRDSIGGTFLVAGLLCVVCSVLVSSAAVALKDRQEANKKLDLQKNILSAAGLYEEGVDIEEAFEVFETRVWDFETDQFVGKDVIDPETYDQRTASKDPKRSSAVESKDDIAGIKRRERYSKVYLLREDNKVSKVILPVRGLGLWGLLWGMFAIDADGKTTRGLTYYEHKETPGLGGEVDNPNWKAQWPGKTFSTPDGEIIIEVSKGGNAKNDYSVDGLAGATITSNGVEYMLQYWLGEEGFAPLLDQLRSDKGLN